MIASLDDIPVTYDAALRTLARWHAEGSDPSLQIIAFDDPGGSEVRLLEISDQFPGTGAVRPLAFGRSDELPFKSAVALVTPREWEQVQAGVLELPAGWNLSSSRKIWPDDGT